jgi:hypothetical protein
MSSVFSLAILISFSGFLVFTALALNSRFLNAILVLSPTFVTTLYGPMTGQSPFALATTGSVSDRISYMVFFTGPFVIGFLGALNRRRLDGASPVHRVPLATLLCIGCILTAIGLKIISIFLLSPVNGQGQSIYVPAFAAFLALASILVVKSSLISIVDARRALEVLLVSLYSFLLLNIFIPIVAWQGELEIFQNKQLDGFRFSPFAGVLRIPGRESYFETDPQSFGVYSTLAFSVLMSSKSRFIRVVGSMFVLIVGSTSQSRLFYLSVVILLLLKISQATPNVLSRIFAQGIFLAILCSYFYLLVFRSPGENSGGLSSLSGRTGVWESVFKNWNDQSALFGYMGAYSLGDFSAENSGRFIYYHAHNVILQYLWDWGVVGLALILIFLASLFFASKSLTPEGWFISAAIIFTGLIEVTLPNTLLSSKFVFILLLVKHIIPSDSVDQSRKRAESETS